VLPSPQFVAHLDRDMYFGYTSPGADPGHLLDSQFPCGEVALFSHLPDVTDSEVLASVTAAAKRPRVAPDEFTTITAIQYQLYQEVHAAAGKAVRPPRRPGAESSAFARLRRSIQKVFEHSEEFSVFCQAYAHLTNAALNDQRVADELLALSGGRMGPGASLLKRLLRFAAADALVGTVQRFLIAFLETADEETVHAALVQLAGIEWAVDPDDVHKTWSMDTTGGDINEVQAGASRFRTLLGPDAESGTPSGQCLTPTDSAAWGEPDHGRIRTWRRRYVAAHKRSIDWALAKASAYRKAREPLAPYGHPESLEAAVLLQLRQEADRAASARLIQIDDSVAQMALRRVHRRADRRTTPFDPRHMPSARGMLFLDTPFTLPTGQRIVGYVWGPWTPQEEEGWLTLNPGGGLVPLEIPECGTTWTWVTVLTCDESLLSLPFAPYTTLLLRPGSTLEPETRLRDPENPGQYQERTEHQGRNELLTRHVRSLWELLTQHKRSSVKVISEEVHEAKPREQRSHRRRGIADSGHVTTMRVDPEAGERYQARRYSKGRTGRKLTVRYWRDEHERQQCPNSHEHAARQAEEDGCPHYEITIPEHPVGPPWAPWSDQLLRARSRSTSRR